ncbi:hypothetical protein GFY24_39605 [Nocardia sp. SYP-A9097]|uniref:hypothetical protein n=1 Tax=Nocardia sp. SYP-A9097 TaxID=2663237 RepID=UPI00129A1EE3|nr:hypothetical protein [Nocardia sp. SYP-A9097]MRH93447.1 hypothetical protein [Nocardia sp. SYP-A9097]
MRNEIVGSATVRRCAVAAAAPVKSIAAIWTAQLLSILGDCFYALAIMWVALQRSGPVAMGAVAIAESVPFILIGTFEARLLRRRNQHFAMSPS